MKPRPPAPRSKPLPEWREQLDALVGREVDLQLGAPGTLLLLLAQAPIIGAFIGLAWRGEDATRQTHFIMALAAIWMGCMNACTAIVAERAVFQRERMFDLDIRAYLLAKLHVLAVASALQAGLLLAAQGHFMLLGGSVAGKILFFLTLSTTSLAASGLGLLVSAFSKTPYSAVVSVPIVVIPQVVFSEVVLQDNIHNTLPSRIEKLTLTKWCYEALRDAHNDIEWLVQLKCLLALAAGLAVLLLLAAGKLRLDDA